MWSLRDHRAGDTATSPSARIAEVRPYADVNTSGWYRLVTNGRPIRLRGFAPALRAGFGAALRPDDALVLDGFLVVGAGGVDGRLGADLGDGDVPPALVVADAGVGIDLDGDDGNAVG